LFSAAQSGSTDVVSLLLKKGADVNARNGSTTALSIASRQNNAAIVQLLVNAGAKQ
jgi:ankyrin repeat protein